MASKTELGTEVMTVFDDGNLRNKLCGGNRNKRGMLLLVSKGKRQPLM